jgi:3-oxo-5alpha-steroid 4-dehydrogenase
MTVLRFKEGNEMTQISVPTPEILTESHVTVWDEAADVVVVGYGGAGASAAIEARRHGVDVLVVERASGGGGATGIAGGHVYLGGGTPVQIACGFEDTAEEMYKYLEALTPDPHPAKLRLYCEESVAHFHWLEEAGVPFERSYYPGKAAMQPGSECLIWSGNEKAWPFRDKAKPAPRGH